MLCLRMFCFVCHLSFTAYICCTVSIGIRRGRNHIVVLFIGINVVCSNSAHGKTYSI